MRTRALLIAALCGCASAPKGLKLPAWTETSTRTLRANGEAVLFGVGTVSVGDDQALARSAAVVRARANVVPAVDSFLDELLPELAKCGRRIGTDVYKAAIVDPCAAKKSLRLELLERLEVTRRSFDEGTETMWIEVRLDLKRAVTELLGRGPRGPEVIARVDAAFDAVVGEQHSVSP